MYSSGVRLAWVRTEGGGGKQRVELGEKNCKFRGKTRTRGWPHSTSQGPSEWHPRRLHTTTIINTSRLTRRRAQGKVRDHAPLRIDCALPMSCSKMSAIDENKHELSSGTIYSSVQPYSVPTTSITFPLPCECQ